MREKLRLLDIRISELCDYLHFSRPTMYRFIENYESGNYRGVDHSALKLFRYIENTPNIGKKNVISYIINNINDSEDTDSQFIRSMKEYENSKMNNEYKTGFIQTIVSSSEMDDVIKYIAECSEILAKDEFTDDDYNKIGTYILFRYNVENNKKLTKIQLEKIKKLMEAQ